MNLLYCIWLWFSNPYGFYSLIQVEILLYKHESIAHYYHRSHVTQMDLQENITAPDFFILYVIFSYSLVSINGPLTNNDPAERHVFPLDWEEDRGSLRKALVAIRPSFANISPACCLMNYTCMKEGWPRNSIWVQQVAQRVQSTWTTTNPWCGSGSWWALRTLPPCSAWSETGSGSSPRKLRRRYAMQCCELSHRGDGSRRWETLPRHGGKIISPWMFLTEKEIGCYLGIAACSFIFSCCSRLLLPKIHIYINKNVKELFTMNS